MYLFLQLLRKRNYLIKWYVFLCHYPAIRLASIQQIWIPAWQVVARLAGIACFLCGQMVIFPMPETSGKGQAVRRSSPAPG
jgi:hypothetical protein